MEVIICTPATSRNLIGFARGCYQGDAPKTNLKQKQNATNSKKISGSKLEITNNSFSLSHSFWVGVVVASSLCASLFLNAPKAQAATLDWNNPAVSKVLADANPVTASVQDGLNIGQDQTTDDFIEKPFVAETAITPPDPVRVLGVSYRRSPVDYSLVTGPHYFPYGYCTFYVSQKRTVTWAGNAGTWLNGASSSGITTGANPKPGAIMVTNEGGRAGHVAYVESVDDNSGKVTVSEMNFKGFGIVSTRTLAENSRVIKGYIY